LLDISNNVHTLLVELFIISIFGIDEVSFFIRLAIIVVIGEIIILFIGKSLLKLVLIFENTCFDGLLVAISVPPVIRIS